MDTKYTVKRFSPGDDLHDAFEIRTTVFVDEQGFDPKLEIDDIDPTAHHVVLYAGDTPVATGRVFKAEEMAEGWYILGRIAVLKECRGGTGTVLMGHLEELARSIGAKNISLGAQKRVEGFYSSLGYVVYGEEYLDEGCPHIHMKKSL